MVHSIGLLSSSENVIKKSKTLLLCCIGDGVSHVHYRGVGSAENSAAVGDRVHYQFVAVLRSF